MRGNWAQLSVGPFLYVSLNCILYVLQFLHNKQNFSALNPRVQVGLIANLGIFKYISGGGGGGGGQPHFTSFGQPKKAKLG